MLGGAQEYLISAVQVQQLTEPLAACGFVCWRWNKRKLLDKVGWLSVRQLVFYHTVLQVHKTLKTKVPKPLHQSLAGTSPRNTRSTASGKTRNDNSFTSQATGSQQVSELGIQLQSRKNLSSGSN